MAKATSASKSKLELGQPVSELKASPKKSAKKPPKKPVSKPAKKKKQ